MKKIIIISSLVLSLFANDDYVPLSNLSNQQKEEYNFVNKNSVVTDEIKQDNKVIDEKKELIKPINKEFVKVYRDWETDRKSTRLNSSHSGESRMPSSA